MTMDFVLNLDKEVISPTTESQSTVGAFSFVLPEGYSIALLGCLLVQKSPGLLIGSVPGICGGAPIILGTRLAVHQIIEEYEALGRDKERILKAYPHITSSQLDAAVEYYGAHREEIDGLIEQEKIAEHSE